jgi:DNA-binding GntR family transcriptional regulator
MPPSEPRKTPAQIRFDTIYHAIRQRICLVHYPPGSSLVEADLAAEFNVSRTPIRKVLGRLESEGLIESRHGAGTFVTQFDLDSLYETYQFRMQLASLSGQLSPITPGDDLLIQIEELLRDCETMKQARSLERFSILNMNFSQACFSLIGNQPLRKIVEQLYYQTARIWSQYIPRDKIEGEFDFFILEVREVLAALRIGDMEAFGYIRRAHLSMNVSRLMLYKEEQRRAGGPATAGRDDQRSKPLTAEPAED